MLARLHQARDQSAVGNAPDLHGHTRDGRVAQWGPNPSESAELPTGEQHGTAGIPGPRPTDPRRGMTTSAFIAVSVMKTTNGRAAEAVAKHTSFA